MEIKKKSKISVAIPTASMPDIIFMLLIFFMVATVIRQYTGLKVSLPAAQKIQKIDGSTRHVMTIWLDGKQVVCNDMTLKDVRDLRQSVYQVRVDNPLLKIALKIDKEVDMGMVNKVHQELRKASALNVYYFAVKGGGD
jgi:biopolymer transport protein ExbD